MRSEDECECASESSGRSDTDLLNVLNIIREGTNGKTTISVQENSRHQEWASLGLPHAHMCLENWKNEVNYQDLSSRHISSMN